VLGKHVSGQFALFRNAIGGFGGEACHRDSRTHPTGFCVWQKLESLHGGFSFFFIDERHSSLYLSSNDPAADTIGPDD